MSVSQRTVRIVCALFLSALIGTAVVITGCERQAQGQAAPPPPEVDVAQPIVREGVEWDEYTGRLGAVETVEVRPRVDGYIQEIHFKAGQIVKKGDLLFTIDPRPYTAELDRTTAQVEQAQAELKHAEFDLHRIEGYMKNEVAPEKEYRDVLFAHDRAQAEVERTRSERRLAELNVEWTGVVAPISGRVSRELVTVGNLVHDGSTAATLLTTIVSLDPIYCYFDMDEQAYLKYARMSESGERADTGSRVNAVHVALFDEQEFPHEGRMESVDNAIDALTGTLRGRAVLPNPDGLLMPGLFVRVRLVGSGVRPMVFVPDAAIVTDQTARLVFVVDEQRTVRPHPVTVGRLQNGLRRILSGLTGNETVVVNGVQRVRAGTPVMPKPVTLAAGGSMTDGKQPVASVASTTGGTR